jgi:DtxR family transcriptional regulator, Mn-dependent transcriptional regulator
LQKIKLNELNKILMTLTYTEENYLKSIYKLMETESKSVSTNSLAAETNTTAASVTDMIKRLSEKELLHYERYHGVTLTEKGNIIATKLIRKHRLWEVFLVEWLHFSWDEVHELAEQLEHIQSEELVKRLDIFLNHPKFDPHGDPIPDEDGNFTTRKQVLVNELKIGEGGVVVGVNEHAPVFLQYLDKLGINIGTHLTIVDTFDFDGARKVLINHDNELLLSGKVVENVFLKTLNRR